jgi:hypothetical protein
MRLRPSSNAPVVVVVGFVALWLVAIGGWVANIVKLFGLASVPDPNYVMAVLRAVGIFVAPLGAILGFL